MSPGHSDLEVCIAIALADGSNIEDEIGAAQAVIHALIRAGFLAENAVDQKGVIV